MTASMSSSRHGGASGDDLGGRGHGGAPGGDFGAAAMAGHGGCSRGCSAVGSRGWLEEGATKAGHGFRGRGAFWSSWSMAVARASGQARAKYRTQVPGGGRLIHERVPRQRLLAIEPQRGDRRVIIGSQRWRRRSMSCVSASSPGSALPSRCWPPPSCQKTFQPS